MCQFLNAPLLDVFLPNACGVYGVLGLPSIGVDYIVNDKDRIRMTQTETLFHIGTNGGLVMASVNKNQIKCGGWIGFYDGRECDRGITQDESMPTRILLVHPGFGNGDIGVGSQVKGGHLDIGML